MSTAQDTNHMAIARTILAQLGGTNKLAASIGAKNFVALPAEESFLGGVMFNLMRNTSKANKVRVRLHVDDTYTVELLSCRGIKVNTKFERDTVYWDDLQRILEEQTGLRFTPFG